MQPPLKKLFSAIPLWIIFTFHLFLSQPYISFTRQTDSYCWAFIRQKCLYSKTDNKTQDNFREYQKEKVLHRGQSKLEYFDYLFPLTVHPVTSNTMYIFCVCSSTALSCLHYLKCSFIVRPCSGVIFPSFMPLYQISTNMAYL